MANSSLVGQTKNLLAARSFGALSTLSQRVPGYPFASIVTYACDTAGSPIFLLSGLALHTMNVLANPKASLLVFADAVEHDPLNSARVNLFGDVGLVGDSEISELRTLYLARHPAAEQWVDFGDFALYRMVVVDAYYVGGFGVMGWVAGADLLR